MAWIYTIIYIYIEELYVWPWNKSKGYNHRNRNDVCVWITEKARFPNGIPTINCAHWEDQLKAFYVVISSQINHFRVVTGSEDLVCIITRDHVGPAHGIIHGCKSCYLWI
eukprot:1032337_1